MKYALLFIAITAVAWLFRELFSRRERRLSVDFAGTLVVPALLGAGATIAIIFFNLNFNGKLI